jgi:signal transduction histidine kinase/DNA-binding response OmpR family regulator
MDVFFLKKWGIIMSKISYNGRVYNNSENLSLETMSNIGFYTFEYFPKDKLIINSKLTMEAYNCKEFYGNMPYDFIDEFVEEEYAPKYVEMYRNIDTGAKQASTAFKTKGTERMCKVTLTPNVYNDDGSLYSAIGVVEDITDAVDHEMEKESNYRKALQDAFDAANAANHAKSDFLANMSHDIRTPMNAIIGMTAIAGTHIDDKERVADCLKKITASSKHLLSLINEVLDMSKIESGKIDMAEEDFNLSELIDNLLAMIKPQIQAHFHELEVNINNVEHEQVIGDSLRIQQLFVNIMSNAIKYTPDGGTINLTITEKPASQLRVGCYEIVVEDNGIGMSEEYISRLFEPFTRANDERIGNIQGTGLGMAIAKNIVNMMGGDICVESKLNEGTRFTITLYMKLQDVKDVHYEEFMDLFVLVVDDDEISVESACCMLNELGMRTEGVCSGREAVKRVVEHHGGTDDYYAIIIDWKMPDMDGIATTKAIRKAVGDDVPIIIISAYDWPEIEQEAREAGANAFVSKPLFKSRLAHLFNSLVGNADKGNEAAPLSEFENIDLSGNRALLVEDNELNREIAVEILEMTKINVEVATDGDIAVDMVKKGGKGYYDVVFMDIQMPRMNGYEATREIRKLENGAGKDIPIIAMTANAFAEDVQMAMSAGMNEHVPKPLDLKSLASILKKWVLS